MNVSIVIPVYNEARELAACLAAIAAQSIRPFEVIVVDNNSTDDSADIARRFAFVKLLYEPRQGVLHARTRGFDAARGDIIGRIDADTVIPADWVATVQTIFADKTVDAVSGSARYIDVIGARLLNAADLFFRQRLAAKLGNRTYLWGANMAMRRPCWQAVRPTLCNRGQMHEDFDIAIHLQELGLQVSFEAHLVAQVSSRRVDTAYLDFMRYVLRSPGTYAQHRIKQRVYMYEVVLLCAVMYAPARLLYRAHDPITGGFSLGRLFSPVQNLARVDPTSNIV